MISLDRLSEAEAKAKLMFHFMSWIISYQISISQWEQCLKKNMF